MSRTTEHDAAPALALALAPALAPARAPQLTIVALGASAGGIHALQGFFAAMPADERFAFVVITHLSPSHASQMAEVLAHATSMPVSEAQDGAMVQPAHVYVIPPDRYMGIKARRLTLTRIEPRPVSPHPINYFMAALAEDQQDRAVGIVLSGTSHDGAVGLKEIKACGGLALVQEPAEAEFPGMPTSAIDTAAVDAVLPVEKMAAVLIDYVRHAHDPCVAADAQPADSQDAADDLAQPLAQILALLLERTGRDFSWYRRPMLLRRLRRRIGLQRLADVGEYVALLHSSPDELQLLLKDFLISVTEFFRQPDAWQVLEDQVLPRLLDEHIAAGNDIRVWTPGCATGEESYSIAMLLMERIASLGSNIPINVFGSDIDVDALEVARAGSYPQAIADVMPPRRLAHFFDKDGSHYVVSKALREAVLFAPQDLVRDPPFSKLDLIVCRNVLIYLEPAQQSRILEVFHFALNPGGVLFLGKSESLGPQADLFEALSRPHRIFRRIDTAVRPPRLFDGHWNGPGGFLTPAPRSRPLASLLPADILREQLAGRSPDAALLLNRESRVIYFHGRTDRYVEPRGEPTTHLRQLLREGLSRSVRAIVKDARTTGQVAQAAVTAWRDDRIVHSHAWVEPVGDFKRDGFLLLCFDEPHDGVEAVPATVDAVLQEEVLRLRDDLAATERDAESNTAELRIAHEEAMSLNEELQSSYEELQTSKEELQSMNEELSSVNSQLEDKIGDLEHALSDVRNLMDSTQVATLFLDRELRIRRFTQPTMRLFYLIDSDRGRPLRDIAGPTDDPTLLSEAAAVRDGLATAEREVAAADGVQYLRRILPYRTRDDRIDGVVITYTDITALLKAASEARRLAAVLNDSNDAVIAYDFDGRIQLMNRGAKATYGYRESDAQPGNIATLEPAAQAGSALALAMQARQAASIGPVNARRNTRDGRTLDVTVTVSALRDEAGVVNAVVSTERDVTEKLRLETEARFRAMADLLPMLLKIEDARGGAEFLNRAWIDFTGLSSTATLHDRGWHGHVHPDDLKPFLKAVRKARAANQRFEGDLRLRDADGGYRWMRLSEVARSDEAGVVLGYVSISVDIEERKRAEQVIAQETSRKDEFLAMLAHELRNPLAGISNAAALLEHGARADTQDTKFRWATGVITRQVQHLARLVDDLMDVARVSSGKIQLNREPVDLLRVIAQAREQTESSISSRSQRLVVRMPAESLYVEGDPVRLIQVLANLLSNASKYSDREAQLSVEASVENGEAVLKVRDNGCGISAQMLPRVFDLFAQEDKSLDRSQGGLGLGLTLVQRLVAAHGGAVEAHSEGRGRGSEFVVRLPLLEQPQEATPQSAASDDADARRILVIDDDADGADTLSMLLRQAGHTVDTAYDGPSGLAIAASAHPDVIVLDIGLPGMTGYEVARQLRANRETADALLIALTGYSSSHDARRAKDAGFDFHLIKPVAVTGLLDLLMQAHSRRS